MNSYTTLCWLIRGGFSRQVRFGKTTGFFLATNFGNAVCKRQANSLRLVAIQEYKISYMDML